MPAAFEYVLRFGDDNLIIAQRLSEWSSRAHDLEEDIALANIALDHLGQARALLAYAGELEGAGRSEDHLAFHRGERDFVNLLLAERPNRDFAHTILRQLLFSFYQELLWEGLAVSADRRLAGVAGKAVKEARYHREHAAAWAVRLGAGTEESHRRMTEALAALWPFTDEPFAMDDLDGEMIAAGMGPDMAARRPAWAERTGAVLAEAGLEEPSDPYRKSGGRRGMHGEEFGFLLAEMQFLPRAMPEAVW